MGPFKATLPEAGMMASPKAEGHCYGARLVTGKRPELLANPVGGARPVLFNVQMPMVGMHGVRARS